MGEECTQITVCIPPSLPLLHFSVSDALLDVCTNNIHTTQCSETYVGAKTLWKHSSVISTGFLALTRFPSCLLCPGDADTVLVIIHS